MNDADHTTSGESNQVGGYEGVHRDGKEGGRHNWNPARSVSGAVRVPIGDLHHTDPKEN